MEHITRLRRPFISRIEILEARIAPASLVSVSGGNLSVVDGAGLDDAITISVNGASYRFSDPGGITAGPGTSSISANEVDVPIASVTGSFTVMTNGGGDSVLFSGAISTAGDVTVDTGTGNDFLSISGAFTPGGHTVLTSAGAILFDNTVTLAADKNLQANAGDTIGFFTATSAIAATGTGIISLVTTREIILAPGASLNSTDGAITLSANTAATGIGFFVGIVVDGGIISSTGLGAVSLTGRGGDSGGNQHGISLLNGGFISGGLGGTTLVGNGGNLVGGNGSIGVLVDNGIINSTGGNVSVTGTGGNGADSGESSGVYLATASALISASGFGTVTVTGTGGNAATSTNTGVDVRFGARITSANGDVSVTGTGGPNPGGVNPGVRAIMGGQIDAPALGSLTVVGSAGPGLGSHGVAVEGMSSILGAAGGPISVTGQTLSGTGFGVFISNGAISTGGSSPITINTDSIDIQSAGVVIDSGAFPTTLAPRTLGGLIDLGGADVLFGGPPSLGITDAELDLINANPLRIGTATSGRLTVTAPITAAGLALNSGTDILFNSGVTLASNTSLTADAVGTISVTGATLNASSFGFITLTAGRNIEMFSGAGINTVDANITLFANTTGTSVGGSIGIALEDVGLITTGAGSITLVATGGNGGGGSVGNRGISLTNAFISTTLPAPLLGEANVSITGTGGTGSSGNDGVYIDGGAVTSTAELTLTGFLATGAGGIAINIQNGAAVTTTDATAFLSLQGDSMRIAVGGLSTGGINAASGTGIVTLNTTDPLRIIDLGANDTATSLGLTDAELDGISAGIIAIGNNALSGNPGGEVRILGNITRAVATDLDISTGQNPIEFTGGSINTGGGLLNLNTGSSGRITADGSGVDIIAGALAISVGNNGVGTRANPLRLNVGILATTIAAEAAEQFFTGTAGIGAANPDVIGLDSGTGTIHFISGTFTLLGEGLIANLTKVVVATGATFSLGGHSEVIQEINGPGTIDLAGGNLTTGANRDTTLDSRIIGTGSLTKVGNGTLRLTNTASTFTGNIEINSGAIRVTSDAPLGDPANTLFFSDGTLRVPVGFTTDRSIVVREGGTGTLDIASGTMKLTGVITTGSSTLNKTGAGALRFGADFTGTTRVEDGTLTTSGSTLNVNGQGSVLVVVVDDGAGGTRIDEIRLINTNADTVIFIAGPTNPNKTSTVTKIISSDPAVEIGTITLGANIILGDGIADAIPDVDIEGKVGNLIFGNVAANTLFTLGKGLPYNVSGDVTTPDSYNNRPNITLKTILGPGVIIDVTGDGTPSGVGGGGLGVLKVNSWAFTGTVQTTQSIGTFKVKTGNTFVNLLVDNADNGSLTVADMGQIKIVQGSWGGTGSEIEGSVGSFDAKAFLTGASLSAASIAKFTTKKGKFAGTITLTDANNAALSTFTVASSFTGFIDAAGPITTLLVKGAFKGSLKAKAIGTVTAASFDGTTADDQAIFGDPFRHNIWATGGSIGTLKTTAGGIQQYEVIASTTFGGFSIKHSSALTDAVGLDGVFVSAASIGNTSVTLASPVGAALIGIRDSVFSSATTIGTITSSHSVQGTIVAAGTTLGAVTVGMNLTGSQLLAGVHFGADGALGGGDDLFTRAASIAAITVSGKLATTSIAAGIAPGANGLFGDGDDIAAAGISLAGKAIGKITLGAASGSLIPGTGAIPAYAIEAASFTSITVGGIKTTVIPPGSVLHAPGTDAATDIALLVI